MPTLRSNRVCRAGLDSSREVRHVREVLVAVKMGEPHRLSTFQLFNFSTFQLFNFSTGASPTFQLFNWRKPNLSTFQLAQAQLFNCACADESRRTRYCMPTLTRKKRLAAFVSPQEPSVRLSRPSTVYTRFASLSASILGFHEILGYPSTKEITVRRTQDARL